MSKYLIAADFDGTIAATNVPSPTGMNVDEASRLAIQELFGAVSLGLYVDNLKTLANAEPGEIVRAILEAAKASGKPVEGYVDSEEATNRFVDRKLSYLLPLISPEWPALYPGVRDFFDAVQRGGIAVDVAVVSSGHKEFIGRVFEINGLTVPKIFITSEHLRSRSKLGRQLQKPYPFQLALAHRRWEDDHRQLDEVYDDLSSMERKHGKPRMMYIGDDPIKDGGLAENSRVVFGMVPYTHPESQADPSRGQLSLSFADLTKKLLAERNSLVQGESFSQIFLGVPDRELFPRIESDSERPYGRWLRDRQEGKGPEKF